MLFFVPKGSSFSIRSCSKRDFNLLERIFVAIFSFDYLNSLNLDFLCKMTSLNINSDHLSPNIETENAIAQVRFLVKFNI